MGNALTTEQSSRRSGSLTGIRVVDLTTNVAGPFATQILGDLGADVIKVERPTGDDTRGWGPPFWEGSDESVSFSTLNRNKRSIVLDLRAPSGLAAIERLITQADVLVQNMRPGSLDRLGLSWKRLQELNPGLVYCDMSGFGHVGPRSEEPAYDPLMQAFSGLMSLTGEDGGAPVRIPVSILDKGTGMWAVIAILDALRARDQAESEGGAHLQLSLLETALAWEPAQLLGYVATGKVPERRGSGTAGIAPYQAFPTADGHVIVAAGNQRLWQRLCSALERPGLLDDPRFIDNEARVRNLVELVAELSKLLSNQPTQHWVDHLQNAGVPVTPIQTVDQVVADEQVRAMGTIDRFDRSDTGREYGLVRLPVHVNGERYPVVRLPPKLGEHTSEVMAAIGIDENGPTRHVMRPERAATEGSKRD